MENIQLDKVEIEFDCNKENNGVQVLVYKNKDLHLILRNMSQENNKNESKFKITIEKIN